jgi:hypothetical protein
MTIRIFCKYILYVRICVGLLLEDTFKRHHHHACRSTVFPFLSMLTMMSSNAPLLLYLSIFLRSLSSKLADLTFLAYYSILHSTVVFDEITTGKDGHGQSNCLATHYMTKSLISTGFSFVGCALRSILDKLKLTELW